jgi:hypothetical protein
MASGALVVDGSLKFDQSKNQHLKRTPSSASNRRTWTWSGWAKRSELSSSANLFAAYGGSITEDNFLQMYLSNADIIRVISGAGGGTERFASSAVFRDTLAWYHFVFACDTTQATAADRFKVYVNGSSVTKGSGTDFPQNTDTAINNNIAHYHATYNGTSEKYDGHLSNVYLIDGQALDASYFGFTDGLTNTWRPKKFSGNFTIEASGIIYSDYGSGTVNGTRTYDKAFDGSTSTFCEPSDNQTVTFDFTSLPGGGITVSSSLRMYLNKAGTPAASHFTVNGTNLGGSVPSNNWLTINSVSLLETITLYHQSGSSSVELFAVEVDGSILTDGLPAQGTNSFYLPMDGNSPIGHDKSNPNPINNGTTWSSGISGTSGGSAVTVTTPGNAFDGSVSTRATFTHSAGQDSIITWTVPGGGISGSTFRIYCYQPQGTSGANQYLSINGGTYVVDTSWNGVSANADGWSASQTIPGGTLTSIALKLSYGGASSQSLYAVEVDGVVLVDNMYGNGWTPVNFGGSVALDNPQVSGAKPILNTDGGGNVARVGVFGSEVGAYYAVTVSNPGSGNKYYLDGVLSANPTLTRGATYTFDQSDSSNSGHPLVFGTTAEGNNYSDGVTTNGTPGSAGAYTKITVPHNAPDTLYYHCSVHSGMGSSTSQITDETKADPYAWKNVLALPLLGTTADVSNRINSGSTTKTITVNGSPTGNSTITSNFYSQSYKFAGSDSFGCGTSSDFQMTGDFTLECWIYPVDTTDRSVFVTYDGSNYFAFNVQPGTGFNIYPSAGATNITDIVPYTNGWQHIAMVRSGSSIFTFLNGKKSPTTITNSSTIGYNNVIFYVGGLGTQSTGSYNGYIQDVRIYKGIAKYTSNFVVPSTNPDILPDTPSGVSGSSKLAKITDGAVSFDGSGDYLETSSTTDFAFGTGDFTLEAYIYATSLPNTNNRIITSGTNSAGNRSNFQLMVGSTGYLEFDNTSTYQSATGLISTGRWYHVAATKASGTLRLFIDGVNVKEQADSYNVTENGGVTIGREAGFSSYWNGFISNLHIVKGTALYTSDFTPPTRELTNVTNTKLLCCQSNTSAIAAAVSPGTITANGNAAATNFNPFTTDINAVRGQETGYATWNAVNNNLTLSNGNLEAVSTSNTWRSASGTIAMTSGKWYWEVTATTVQHVVIGIARASATAVAPNGSEGWEGSPDGYLYYSFNGNKYHNSSSTSYGASYTAGDVVGVAWDADAGNLVFYKNGVSQGTAWSGLTNGPFVPAISLYNTTSSASANFGQKPFKFPPPDGFQPLNGANVRPETVITRPDHYVGATIYTGNGASSPGGSGGTQSINVGLEPDLIWIKDRTQAHNNNLLDTIRGVNSILMSDSTVAPVTNSTDAVTSFNSDGFTLGDNGEGTQSLELNKNGNNYVAWTWRAGGSKNTFNKDDVGYASAAAAGLTGGTITPTGSSVGTKQGFSIIKYTGTDATSNTFSHGLSQKPDFAIFKNLSQNGDDWIVYHTSLGATKRVKLNSTAAADSQTSQFNDTEPTSSLFTIGTYDNINKLNNNYISYLWHDVPGLQKFGSYEGNESTNGPFVELGFRPAILLVKNADEGSNDWKIYDGTRNPHNVVTQVLYPNAANGEDANTGVDFLSNGFKWRDSGSAQNGAETIIYAAWAEAPTFNLYGAQSNAR